MEENARLHCRAGRQCKVEEVTLPCAFQHVELVRDGATHVIVSPQDVRKQDAVAASSMHLPPQDPLVQSGRRRGPTNIASRKKNNLGRCRMRDERMKTKSKAGCLALSIQGGY